MLMQLMHSAMAQEGGRPNNSSDFWYKSFLPVSSSGVVVTPEKVMNGQSALVYTCVRILAEAISVLPVKVYRRLGSGEREEAPTHPAYRLLHDRPNGWQTPVEFKQYMTACRVLRGNAYALQILDGDGNIAELRPLHPDYVRAELLANGRVRYMVRDSRTGQETAVPQDFMFHLRSGISNDGVTGLSVLAASRNSIGLSIAAENHGASSFKNGAVPSLTITHPDKLQDEARERLRQEWYETHGGSNLGSVAVLDEGIKVEKLGMTNEDAQYLESRKMSREEIAAAFRVPLFMVNAMEGGASFSSLEQVSRAFVMYTLLPLITEWEQAINRDLITSPQTFFSEILADAYLRADFTARMTGYNQSWWLTGNEIRAKENLAPLPQKFMDEPQMPLNRGNPGGASQTPNNSNNSPDAHRAAVREMALDAFGRVLRSEVREVAKIRADAEAKPEGEAFAGRLAAFLSKQATYMAATITPVAGVAKTLGVSVADTTQLVADHMEQAQALHESGNTWTVDARAQILTQLLMKEGNGHDL